MTAPDCPLTDLPPTQCAYRHHRGGDLPGHEPIATVGQPFQAAYDGWCPRCDDRIREGQTIARVADGDGWVHAIGCPG